jgi:hypothetical protein
MLFLFWQETFYQPKEMLQLRIEQVWGVVEAVGKQG